VEVGVERREVLRLLMYASGGSALATLAPDELLALGARLHDAVARHADAAPGVLTPAQRATAIAAMETIVPRTSTPGATDARTVDFLEVMLARWLTPAERDAIVAGLDALDAGARTSHQAAFVRLAPAAQLAMLAPLDAAADAARRSGAPGATSVAGTHWFDGFRFVTVFGWATARVTMEQALGAWPLPGRYDADAPVPLRRSVPRATPSAHAHGSSAGEAR
jgi:hypothetical protein